MLKIHQEKGSLGTQRFLTIPLPQKIVQWSLLAPMTIMSIEDLNLHTFQDNDLNQDQISYRHGNSKWWKIYLGVYIQNFLL